MNNLWIRSTNALSRSLDPMEREAVVGDLAELGMTDRQAMTSVLGLVLRRQLRVWKKWEPWFALVAIIAPVCPVLASLSTELDVGIFPSAVMWLRHGISYDTGISSAAFLAAVCFRGIALITWSWTSAFALGILSRRAIWLNGALFFMLCLISGNRGLLSVRLLWLTPWAWFAIFVKFLVVLIPAYFGLRQSAKSPNLKVQWMIPLAAWTVTMGALAFWTQGWSQAAIDNWSHGASALTLLQLAQRADVWEIALTHLLTAAVLTAPILYMLAMHTFLHRQSRLHRG
jgi:hypothetical protein